MELEIYKRLTRLTLKTELGYCCNIVLYLVIM